MATTPAPDRLVGPDGRPCLGVFDGAAGVVNHADFDYRSPMGRPFGRLRRWVAYNRFQYFGVISPELLAGCAVADTRLAAVAFVYVYRPADRRLVEYSFRTPLAAGATMSDSPVDGTARFRIPGIDIELSAGGGEKGLRVRHRDVDIDASFSETEPPFEPMALCTRTGPAGWVYAQKAAGVPVSGTVSCPLGSFDLAAIDAFAHHDFTAGFMRHDTFWNWACLSGRLGDGTRLGLNVSCGVNETGFSENCVWLDGRVVPVGLARFDFDHADPMSPWRVTTGDGALDLRFTPEGLHAERLNLWLLATNFRQVFGRFDGELRLPGRSARRIDGLYGFCDHFARW